MPPQLLKWWLWSRGFTGVRGERIREGERSGEQNNGFGRRTRAGGEIDWLAEANGAVLAMPWEVGGCGRGTWR